jgi:hypothetical protein
LRCSIVSRRSSGGSKDTEKAGEGVAGGGPDLGIGIEGLEGGNDCFIGTEEFGGDFGWWWSARGGGGHPVGVAVGEVAKGHDKVVDLS